METVECIEMTNYNYFFPTKIKEWDKDLAAAMAVVMVMAMVITTMAVTVANTLRIFLLTLYILLYCVYLNFEQFMASYKAYFQIPMLFSLFMYVNRQHLVGLRFAPIFYVEVNIL